jgi:hypothetical protein
MAKETNDREVDTWQRFSPPEKARRALGLMQIPLLIAAWFLLEYLLVRRLALAWVPLFAGGFVLWWFTTRKTSINARTIIVPYLLTTIMFMAHVCEEYTTYARGLPSITPLRATFEEMVIFAATLGPIMWVLGALMMFKRWPVGFFVASTFLFGMMFIEPSHVVVPFWGGRFHYVGGMWTALPLTAFAWYTFFAIRREIRREKQ